MTSLPFQNSKEVYYEACCLTYLWRSVLNTENDNFLYSKKGWSWLCLLVVNLTANIKCSLVSQLHQTKSISAHSVRRYGQVYSQIVIPLLVSLTLWQIRHNTTTSVLTRLNFRLSRERWLDECLSEEPDNVDQPEERQKSETTYKMCCCKERRNTKRTEAKKSA